MRPLKNIYQKKKPGRPWAHYKEIKHIKKRIENIINSVGALMRAQVGLRNYTQLLPEKEKNRKYFYYSVTVIAVGYALIIAALLLLR